MTLQKPAQLLILLSLLLLQAQTTQPKPSTASVPNLIRAPATQQTSKIVRERTFDVDGTPWVITVVDRHYQAIGPEGVLRPFRMEEVILSQPKAQPPADAIIWRSGGEVSVGPPPTELFADVAVDFKTKDIFFVACNGTTIRIEKLRSDSKPLIDEKGMLSALNNTMPAKVFELRREKQLEILIPETLSTQISTTFGTIESLDVEKRQDTLQITLRNRTPDTRVVTYSLTEDKWK